MSQTKPPVVVVAERVDRLEGIKVTYRKATVAATNPGQRLIDVDVENAGKLEGIPIPEGSFFPRVGDVGELQQRGSRVSWVANRLGPGSVGEDELSPDVSENITIAMDAANGKNKFWFSPDAPTLATPGTTVGDPWMQRDNTTRVITGSWEWDGDSWEPVTYGDQVLSSLTVGKLVGGTATFDLIVGGRIATANTGERTELNPLGLQSFDPTGALATHIGGGTNLLTGEVRTGTGNARHVRMGAAGTSGEVSFYVAGSSVSKVQAFTASLPAAGTEALALRVPIAGTYGAWNSLQIQSDQHAYLLTGTMHVNYGGSATGGAFVVEHATNKGTATTAPTLNPRLRIDEVNGTRFWDDGNRLRMQLSNDGGWSVWDGNDSGNTGDKRITVEDEFTIIYNPAGPNSAYNGQGQIEVQRTQTIIRGNPNAAGDDAYVNVSASGSVGSSARLGFVNRNGEGGLLKFYNLAGDAGGQRMEVRQALDTVFIPIWASAFTVNSDRATKKNIRDLDFSALDKVLALKPRRFAREGADDMPDMEQVGFVTDEMPPELVVGDPASGTATGADVMALLTALVGSVQNINTRLAAIEKGPAK